MPNRDSPTIMLAMMKLSRFSAAVIAGWVLSLGSAMAEAPATRPTVSVPDGGALLLGGAKLESTVDDSVVHSKPVSATKPTLKPDPKSDGKVVNSEDKLSVTTGQVTIGGKPIKYTATAGTMLMKDDAGHPKANFFFVSYKRDLENYDPAKRPITFVFNGGPGAAAVWLHLGTAGPRRVELDDEGNTLGPPHRLVENNFSWLDVTDLVFIDPVGTGYSKPVEGVKGEEFWGVQQDIHSVGDFIRLYTTRNDRWLSPKFLAGESYGTTRAAGLSEFLLDRYGIDVNGIIFISSVLDFQTIGMSGSNDTSHICFLPTFTALAWHFKKLDDAGQKMGLDQLIDEVEAWARGEYAMALARGDNLKADERAQIIKKLAHYTGLSADLIDRANLRIDPGMFRKNLLTAERKIIGRFDGRVTGDDPNPASNDDIEADPSFNTYFAAYTSTATDYLRRVLKYESDLPYETLAGHQWDYGQRRTPLETASNLASAMRKNARLRALFCSGRFDLATPMLATDFTLDHMGLSPEARKRVSRAYFGAGHMVYHRKADLEKLKWEVGKFIFNSDGQEPKEGFSPYAP